MGTTALVPVEEYLSTSYPDGDREYIDGQIVERNIGERRHARIQSLVLGYFLFHDKQFWSAVKPVSRFRRDAIESPMCCLYIGEWPGPERGPLTDPPFLVVEVLSPDDSAVTARTRPGRIVNTTLRTRNRAVAPKPVQRSSPSTFS